MILQVPANEVIQLPGMPEGVTSTISVVSGGAVYYGDSNVGPTHNAGVVISGTPQTIDSRGWYLYSPLGATVDVEQSERGDEPWTGQVPGFGVLAASSFAATYAAVNDGVGNNIGPLQNAMNANANATVYLLPGSYHVDGGGPGGLSLVVPPAATSITFVGLGGPEDTVMKLGPENAQALGTFYLFQKTRGQVINFRNLTLQGPDVLGNGGGNLSGNFTASGLINETGVATLGGKTKFINCIVKNFTFQNASNSTSSYEAYYTGFQGYGSTYRSMGIAGGDDGTTGYDPSKHVWLDHCQVSGYGDPFAGNLFHSLYVGTSMDLLATSCIFKSPASTSTGNMLQHFDSNVALANAGVHAVYDNCYFSTATQGGVLTSYNCPTKFSGCAFDQLQQPGISVAGPTIVDDCILNLLTASGTGITTTTQGQSTGLDWGLTVTGGTRIKFLANVASTGVNIANANATSEFLIDASVVFEGGQGSGNYIQNNSGANGRLEVRAVFKDHPNVAIRNFATNTLAVEGAKFIMSAGTSIFSTAALTRLNHIGNEYATGIGINLSTTPTLMRSFGNYGAGWAAVSHNAQAGATYTIKQYDEFIACTGTSTTALALTLPAASSLEAGQEILIVDEAGGAATHNVTFVLNGADTIKGTAPITTNNGIRRLRSGGGSGTSFWTVTA